MNWNYRVVQNKEGYSIREVYYNGDTVIAWSQEPCNLYGESLEDLQGDFILQQKAFSAPILVEEELERELCLYLKQ